MIIMQDEDGRKCDERCYNAKRLGCNCICGGKNHGLGLEYALAHESNDEEVADDDE